VARRRERRGEVQTEAKTSGSAKRSEPGGPARADPGTAKVVVVGAGFAGTRRDAIILRNRLLAELESLGIGASDRGLKRRGLHGRCPHPAARKPRTAQFPDSC
jgi:hypothetical protein